MEKNIILTKYKNNFKEHVTKLDLIISLILSIIYNISTSYSGTWKFKISVALCFNIFSYFILFLFLTIILKRIAIKLLNKKDIESKLFDTPKLFTLKLALIMLICWLPMLIMLYPGTAINDTWGQFSQVKDLMDGNITLSAHHPILHTLYMGYIILNVGFKTNNWHFAFFLYVIIQAIITSLCFAYSLKYAKNKLGINNKILFIGLLFYCFMPCYAFSIQTIAKDSFFAWIYLLFVIQYIEMIRTSGESLKSIKNLLLLILLSILCILTKKVCYFVLIALFLITFVWAGYNYRTKLLFLITVLVLVHGIIEPKIYKKYEITVSGMQEMLSIPFQQTSLYVITYPDDVTEEEKEQIDKVIDYEIIEEAYDPDNADIIKGNYQKSENKEFYKYLFTWFKMFFKHPDSYIIAFNRMICGWLSGTEYKPLNNMNHHNQLYYDFMPDNVWERSEYFTQTTEIANKIYDFLFKIPIIGLLFTYGFYAMILPVSLLVYLIDEIARKKNKVKNCIFPILPMIISIMLGCYLAPVSVFLEGMRYLYPITYTMVITVMWCIYVKRNNLLLNSNDEPKIELHVRKKGEN